MTSWLTVGFVGRFESHFTAEGEVAAVETAESSKHQGGGGAEAKKPDA